MRLLYSTSSNAPYKNKMSCVKRSFHVRLHKQLSRFLDVLDLSSPLARIVRAHPQPLIHQWISSLGSTVSCWVLLQVTAPTWYASYHASWPPHEPDRTPLRKQWPRRVSKTISNSEDTRRRRCSQSLATPTTHAKTHHSMKRK